MKGENLYLLRKNIQLTDIKSLIVLIKLDMLSRDINNSMAILKDNLRLVYWNIMKEITGPLDGVRQICEIPCKNRCKYCSSWYVFDYIPYN